MARARWLGHAYDPPTGVYATVMYASSCDTNTVTVKLTPLLATAFSVTTTLPDVAPTGTGVTIDVLPQLVGVAAVPLNVTVLEPGDAPKLLPLIVTDVPTGPEVGNKPVMFGVGRTVKLTPLLFTPLAYTTTFPVVAALGTVATIEVAIQLVAVASVPLKLTVPVPCGEPKFVPVIVTDAPTGPEFGERLLITGAGTTVNKTPLLACPPTVTITLPVVAPVGTTPTIEPEAQLEILVTVVPLNVTLLVEP